MLLYVILILGGISMIALPVILVILTLIGVKFSRFHNDYMGLSQTNAVKGFFAVVIVMSHMMGYTSLDFWGGDIYRKIIVSIGQLMVALFFFYSGYGVVVSYGKKRDYYGTFLKNRLLKVLVHFDLAVLLFVILNFALSISFPKSQYITCWIGWGSIGNSNWFIFDTLIFYFITFVAMTVREGTKTGMKIFASLVTSLCLVFWAIMALIYKKDGSYWYDTVLCFPCGIWFGVFKEKIDRFVKRWYFYWPALAVLIVIFRFFYVRRYQVEYHSILAPVFCLVVTFVTMKVKFDNRILQWLGRHSFSIYITQRIPMIVISRLGLAENNILYALLIVLTVFPFAFAFSLLLDRVDRLLFKKKKI